MKSEKKIKDSASVDFALSWDLSPLMINFVIEKRAFDVDKRKEFCYELTFATCFIKLCIPLED